jgi:hypothetical protein
MTGVHLQNGPARGSRLVKVPGTLLRDGQLEQIADIRGLHRTAAKYIRAMATHNAERRPYQSAAALT